MSVNPYAWLLTVPLTIALVQVWYLPADHAIKRLWHAMQQAEADVWCRLNLGLWRPDPQQISCTRWMGHPSAYQAVVAVFGVTSVLSFAAFLGLLPG